MAELTQFITAEPAPTVGGGRNTHYYSAYAPWPWGAPKEPRLRPDKVAPKVRCGENWTCARHARST